MCLLQGSAASLMCIASHCLIDQSTTCAKQLQGNDAAKSYHAGQQLGLRLFTECAKGARISLAHVLYTWSQLPTQPLPGSFLVCCEAHLFHTCSKNGHP